MIRRFDVLWEHYGYDEAALGELVEFVRELERNASRWEARQCATATGYGTEELVRSTFAGAVGDQRRPIGLLHSFFRDRAAALGSLVVDVEACDAVG